MTTPSKAKGSRAEAEVCAWLTGATGLPLYRIIAGAQKDVGDIGGIPDVVIEVKAGAPSMAKWLRELHVERANAGARHAFIIWRTPGTTNPDEWLVITASDRVVPRYPVPGPMARLPYFVRRVATWTGRGPHYGYAGFRLDGFMPAHANDCHAVAMTGAQFETWLQENVDPHAFDVPEVEPRCEECGSFCKDDGTHGDVLSECQPTRGNQ